MDATDLYSDDVVTWSEQQASALRRLAARPELSNAVDWANVIEEIETLGRSEWKEVESHIRNALRHILKGYCDPDSLSRQAWSVETSTFLDEARSEFRNSMRKQIDVDRAWQRAFKRACDELLPYGVTVPPRIPTQSPFTLDELLSDAFTYDIGIATLHRLHRD